MVDRDEHGYVLIAMPWKRQEMISLLDELSDEGEQVRLWVMHGSYPDSSGIDDVFHFFFDDTELGNDVNSEVGNILKNQDEAVAVDSVCKALDQLLTRSGDVSSAMFMADPAWPSLMHLARTALTVLREPR